MVSSEDDYFSIRLTRLFLSFVGFWHFENRREEILLNIRLTYTVSAIVFAAAVLFADFYNCLGDFNAVIYNAGATMPIVLVLVKLTIFIIQRNRVIEIIGYAMKNFWRVSYNDFEKAIMKDCEKKGIFLVSALSFLVSVTIFSYIITPIVENIGKNPEDRILPFKLWVNLPTTVSPYYEITFVIEALSTIHSGVCYCCFDNLLCILTIHTVGQFKMMQNRLENVCQKYVEMRKTTDMDSATSIRLQSEMYCEFKSCVAQHKALINFINKLESLYTFILLGQMMVSSMVMCLSVFQAFWATLNLVRRLIFIAQVLASFSQLLLFTWTCNEIIVASDDISDAAYRCEWYNMPHHGMAISLKQGLLVVMARARRPCFLSAGKFCPMSLQAFAGILSTTASYLALLRQMSEELVG